jgi:glycerol-3-phosphate responsive antiterminator
MQTEEILDVPNSTVLPGCNSITAKSLKDSLDDDMVGGALVADEEEDIATYRRQRRAVCLMRARFLKQESKEDRRVYKS